MTGRLTRSAYEQLIEEDVARVLAEMQPSPERAHVVEVLRASPDREYALPVLRTCGDCRWCKSVSVPPSPSCQHPRTLAAHSIGYMPVDVDAAPPSWCPFHGGR